MNCRQAQRLLSYHCDGALSPADEPALFAHLATCAPCRRRFEEFQALGTAVRETVARSAPADAERRAVGRWAAMGGAGSMSSRGEARTTRFRLVAAAAAVCILALIVLVNGRLDRGSGEGPGDSALGDRQTVDVTRRLGTGRQRNFGGDTRAGGSACVRNTRTSGFAVVRRLKSQLQLREVRLRGLRTEPAQAGLAPFQPATSVAGYLSVPSSAPRSPKDEHRSALPVADLAYLNTGPDPFRRFFRLAPDQAKVMEARLRQVRRQGDDFVTVPPPRIAGVGDRAAVEALAAHKRETAVVDGRLFRKVSLALKGTALEELCNRLREETGIHLVAGRSVADEKVTVFCREMPLRDVMRQLARPFGYAWLRSGKEKEYRYELAQDLRSQLLEEELRSQDRNAALVALDDDMGQYREYLGLTPNELRERLARAKPGEKERMERLTGHLWGPAQMYSRLSPQDFAALRAGQEVVFSANPAPGEQQLPPEVVRGVLQAFPDWRARKQDDGEFDLELEPGKLPDGLPLDQVPEANARVRFKITQNELGQLDLDGQSGVLLKGRTSLVSGEIASGVSPTVRNPMNAVGNAKLKAEPALRARVTIEPKGSCGGKDDKPKLTSADVLEVVHRATGLPIVADFYTRLHDPATVSVRNAMLFDALNRVADAMRLRWHWERPVSREDGGGWLRFRSASYFNDRIKEVPNRLLERWAASRRENDSLTLDDLTEIVQLSEAQLDSDAMGEGARLCYGLAEWDLARNNTGLRPHLRFLASLTKGQRDQARRPEGLAFTTMTLAQQQGFLALFLSSVGVVQRSFTSLEQAGSAVLHVDYETPGSYQWWVQRQVDAGRWSSLVQSPVRASTREAALQAAQKVDPQVLETRIVPTKLRLMLAVTWKNPQAKEPPIFVLRASPSGTQIRATDGMGHIDSGGNGSGEVFEE